jgi:hypothetical protein
LLSVILTPLLSRMTSPWLGPFSVKPYPGAGARTCSREMVMLLDTLVNGGMLLLITPPEPCIVKLDIVMPEEGWVM